jgi:hypothetical protein
MEPGSASRYYTQYVPLTPTDDGDSLNSHLSERREFGGATDGQTTRECGNIGVAAAAPLKQ